MGEIPWREQVRTSANTPKDTVPLLRMSTQLECQSKRRNLSLLQARSITGMCPVGRTIITISERD
ncbi:MAG TPA: hypothetical protein PLN05_12160 [Pyrinomonadaceae bacterium]|nr:hypothetical protein [Chloracidobacterium sp.]HRJ90493.1 hypothetical protein [Pyrinomonadaceae bacterium]HRK51175.1 hypothetical protein [Pyrinomonadaceae bacterium]